MQAAVVVPRDVPVLLLVHGTYTQKQGVLDERHVADAAELDQVARAPGRLYRTAIIVIGLLRIKLHRAAFGITAAQDALGPRRISTRSRSSRSKLAPVRLG